MPPYPDQNGCRHEDGYADIGITIRSGRCVRFLSGKETGCSLPARSARSASAPSRVCWRRAGCTRWIPTPTWSMCSSGSACIRPTGPSSSPRGCGSRCSPTPPCGQSSVRITTIRHHTERDPATTAHNARVTEGAQHLLGVSRRQVRDQHRALAGGERRPVPHHNGDLALQRRHRPFTASGSIQGGITKNLLTSRCSMIK